MNIDTKGLDKIKEELIKRADLIKQEEELKGNTKAEYKMYQKSAYESIGNYFNKLKSILDKQDIKEIMIETGLNIKYCYDKVHKFNDFCNKYKEFGMNKGIRYKNPNCICSSDSYYISCSFKRLNESLSSMYQYLTSMNEADETEEVYVNYSDGCHGGTRTDLAATKELRNLSIDYKKACDELRKEIVKETNKNKSANEEYER